MAARCPFEEDGCKLCGFMRDDFVDHEKLFGDCIPHKPAEPMSKEKKAFFDKAYQNWLALGPPPESYRIDPSDRGLSSKLAMCPQWLHDELKRLDEVSKTHVPVFGVPDPKIEMAELMEKMNLSFDASRNMAWGSTNEQPSTNPYKKRDEKSTVIYKPRRITRNTITSVASPEILANFGPGIPSPSNTQKPRKITKNTATSAESAEVQDQELGTGVWNPAIVSADVSEEQLSATCAEVSETYSEEYKSSSASSLLLNGLESRPKIYNSKIVYSHQTSAPSTPNSSAKESQSKRKVRCAFCTNNGVKEDVATSHFLRDPFTQRLTCPVLRSHSCEICGATGDYAHTRSYCPELLEVAQPRW